MERCNFGLGCYLDQSIQLGRGRLVEAACFFHSKKADGFEHAQRAECIDVSRVFRRLERYGDVRLSAQIIDFVRPDFRRNTRKVRRVLQVTITKLKLQIFIARVLIDVVDALRVEKG